MNYSEQYKHPKWQKKRLEILRRDRFTCQKCKDTETTLHVHHIKYLKNRPPWESLEKDLITLCKDCHELISGLKLSPGEFKKAMIRYYCRSDGSGKFFMASIAGRFIATNEFSIESKDSLIDLRKLINQAIRNNNG